MRSYWEHLKTLENKKGELQHPHFRASALFPVLKNKEMSTRLIFLGYWLLKRNIPSIGNVITLRDESGRIIHREYQEITLPKCYRIELSELLSKVHFPEEEEFRGSLEVEFFSGKPLVFPFPAVTINYYGPHFSSVVHAAERVYNDFEDLQRNEKRNVKESGFDLNMMNGYEPFFAFANGPEDVKETLEIEAINHKNETLTYKEDLTLAPYEMRIIYPAKLLKLKKFLDERPGTLKISIFLPWVFPRMLAGNVDHTLGTRILTHTYYDSSACDGPQDFWIKSGDTFHAATLMLPLFIAPQFENSISFYPIYSPSPFTVAAEIYDKEGKLLAREDNFFILKEEGKFERISLAPLTETIKEGFVSLRLIAKETSEKPIPSRIKVAINIGSKKHLPCNICTNLQPYVQAWEDKKRSFKWMPLLFDQKGAKTILMNSSPLKNFQENAVVNLTFYRESDDATLKREITLPPQGFIVLNTDDEELKTFLQGNIGWATAESSNPYLTTYYFVFHPSGPVGGDHGY